MARYTDPVCKLCRREGEKLYLKGERCFTPKCAFEKRPYPPGMHGKYRSVRPGRESDYAKQLRAKQKHAESMVCMSDNSAVIILRHCVCVG